MKTLVFIVAMLASTAFGAMADDYTYSNLAPKIQRLQGAVLFPVDIERITVDHGQGPEQHYRYRLIRVLDVGQKVHQDRKKWVQENRALLYEYAYGDLKTVVEAIEKNDVAALKAAAESKLAAVDGVSATEKVLIK